MTNKKQESQTGWQLRFPPDRDVVASRNRKWLFLKNLHRAWKHNTPLGRWGSGGEEVSLINQGGCGSMWNSCKNHQCSLHSWNKDNVCTALISARCRVQHYPPTPAQNNTFHHHGQGKEGGGVLQINTVCWGWFPRFSSYVKGGGHDPGLPQ